MRNISLSIAALLLAGFGCTAKQTAELTLPTAPPASAPQETPGSTPITPSPTPQGRAYYVAYSSGQYDAAHAEGRPVLLYFWASWCPICRAEEPKLKMIVENMDVPVAGFRVNYDTETALKQQYRVTYQHTTVILDVRGQESARFTGPVADAELQAAIRAASH